MKKVIILFSVALGIFFIRQELKDTRKEIAVLKAEKNVAVTIPVPEYKKKEQKSVITHQYQQYYVPRVREIPPQYYPNGTVVGNYYYLNGVWYLRLN